MLQAIYEKSSGDKLMVEAVDAKECVNGGFYSFEPIVPVAVMAPAPPPSKPRQSKKFMPDDD